VATNRRWKQTHLLVEGERSGGLSKGKVLRPPLLTREKGLRTGDFQ